MVTAFVPKSIKPDVVSLNNILCTHSISCQIDLSGVTCELSVQPDLYDYHYNMVLMLQVNQWVFQLLIDQSFLDLYLKAIGVTTTYLQLPSVLQEGVLNAFFEHMLKGIQGAVQLPVALREVKLVSEIKHIDVTLCLSVKLGEDVSFAKVVLSPDMLQPARDFFYQFINKRHNINPNIPIFVRFEIGTTRINYRDLIEIEICDVILLESKHQDVLIKVSDKLIFRGSYCEQGVRVEEETVEPNYEEEHYECEQMNNEETSYVEEGGDHEYETDTHTEPEQLDSSISKQAIDSVPVTLTFELDRKSISLGELMQIGCGYVFEMQTLLEKPVSILANGQKVGLAEIVKVSDDRLGARVLEIHSS